MHVFAGNTVNDTYLQMLEELRSSGISKSPRGKRTKEIRPVVVELKKSYLNRFLFIPGRKLNYAFALAEVIWILSGRGDYEFIGYYNKNMGKYLDVENVEDIDLISSSTTHNFHASYGRRIRNPYTDRHIDQLDAVYCKLQKDPSTRQAVVTLWDVLWDNYIDSKDFPCNIACMFKITNNQLDISVIRRSNDIIWGYPYNIIQFTSIQEYMANWLGVEVGSYYEYIDSLHMYEDEYQKIVEFHNSAEVRTINLNMEMFLNHRASRYSKAEWDRFCDYFFEKEAYWRKLIRYDTYPLEIKNFVEFITEDVKRIVNSGFLINIFRFLLSYALYKNGNYYLVLKLMEDSDTATPYVAFAAESFPKMRKELIELFHKRAKYLSLEYYNSVKFE